MKHFVLLPLLAGALLFSGCEATVVDDRPYHAYGYGHTERGYYGGDRERDYRYRSITSSPYYHRSDSYYRRGYVNPQPVYATTYHSNSNYSRTRAVQHTQVVTPRGQTKVTVVKSGNSGHKKSHKKDDDRDHR